MLACMEPSFCNVKLTKRTPSAMRYQNLFSFKEFSFMYGPPRKKLPNKASLLLQRFELKSLLTFPELQVRYQPLTLSALEISMELA